MCVDVRYYSAAANSRTENPRCAFRWGQRAANAAAWLLPSAVLALMPKCPACFAAYFAAATGMGLTASTAAYFRSASIVACVALLSAAAVAFATRLRPFRRT